MNFYQAGKYWMEYHRTNSKKNTERAYGLILGKFYTQFGGRKFDEISSDDILTFLNEITEGKKSQTKKIRYSQLSTFFNFIRNNIDDDFRNLCDTPMMRKLFREKTTTHWDIFEKETVDEVIFRTMKPRNRLILELMARGGMRIGFDLSV